MRDRWLISYADLVTLLFALFVVLYAAADNNRARAIADVITQQTSKVSMPGGSTVLPGGNGVTEAQAAVQKSLASNPSLRTRTRVSSVPGGFVISLAEAGFFAPGDASIREDAREYLASIIEALREPSQKNIHLRIEGHTDSTPISNAHFPSNWELSSARAAAVVSYLIANGIASSRLSLAGYAGERPVADNSSVEGRALNRRVDLVVLEGKE